MKIARFFTIRGRFWRPRSVLPNRLTFRSNVPSLGTAQLRPTGNADHQLLTAKLETFVASDGDVFLGYLQVSVLKSESPVTPVGESRLQRDKRELSSLTPVGRIQRSLYGCS